MPVIDVASQAHRLGTLFTAALLLCVPAGAADDRPPIIDMHLHANSSADWTVGHPNPATGVTSPASAEEHMRATLAAMERYNVVVAVVSGPTCRRSGLAHRSSVSCSRLSSFRSSGYRQLWQSASVS